MELRRGVAITAVAAIGLIAGCGEGASSSGLPASASGSGCLSADQVREEERRIAEGIEYTDEEVEAKSDEIAAVQAREC